MKGWTVAETTLVLVDVQGKLAQLMVDKEIFFQRIAIAVKACRILNIPILWCQQVPESLGPTVPEIATHLEGLIPFNKSSFSCWGDPGFRAALLESERNHVLLCGIETHICIYQTARDLCQSGFSVEVLSDAVSSRSIADRNLGLERMAQAGIAISGVEMALFDLLGHAKDPCFRDIARLVK